MAKYRLVYVVARVNIDATHEVNELARFSLIMGARLVYIFANNLRENFGHRLAMIGDWHGATPGV